MLDLEEGLEGRCRLSSNGGRGCGALHSEISLIVRLCDPRANKIARLCALLLATSPSRRSSSTRWLASCSVCAWTTTCQAGRYFLNDEPPPKSKPAGFRFGGEV